MPIHIFAKDLAQALAHTLPAAATDGTRPVLEIIRWDIEPGRIILSAADGFVLVESAFDLDGKDNTTHTARLPREAMALIKHMCKVSIKASGKVPAPVFLEIGPEWRFHFGAYALGVVPFDNKGPDFARVWEAKPEYTDPGMAAVDLNRLNQVLKAAPRSSSPQPAHVYVRSANAPIVISAKNYRAMIMPLTLSEKFINPPKSLRSTPQ